MANAEDLIAMAQWTARMAADPRCDKCRLWPFLDSTHDRYECPCAGGPVSGPIGTESDFYEALISATDCAPQNDAESEEEEETVQCHHCHREMTEEHHLYAGSCCHPGCDVEYLCWGCALEQDGEPACPKHLDE